MLSLAICTYNRAALLPRALGSVTRQAPADRDCEILIVDNGSTDDTARIVAEHQKHDQRIRYVVESKAGIAHARNRAMHEARGEYLAFLDDDAWADENWLANLLEPIRSIQPAPECVVGPVSLVWEGNRPEWFPPRFESLLCQYNMGSEPRFLDADAYLLTTNSLFHRETLLNLGGMRTDLGHRRSVLIGGEDNDIFKRLVGHGHRVYYVPSAVVFHPVTKERQTRRYLLRRLFWDGASQPLFEVTNEKSRAWRDLYREGRSVARSTIDSVKGLVKGDRLAAREGLYRLTQRAGRLRTHLVMSTRQVP